MMVVPGSQVVKRQAEAEGLDEVFRAAGAEWREAGCSMCLAMNGDQSPPASTRYRPPIVTSRAARAPAGEPSWPAPYRRRYAIPAGSPMSGRCRTGLRMPEPLRPSPPPCRCRSITSIPTRSSRPGSLRPPTRKVWARRCSPTGATTATASPKRVRPQPAGEAGRAVLLAGDNFGCGSSREHAAWALQGFGIKAVVVPCSPTSSATTPSRTGCSRWSAGRRPRRAVRRGRGRPDAEVTVDLAAEKFTLPDGRAVDSRSTRSPAIC